MLGLFGSLNLGQRSLQAHQQAIEVTGHNLANVNQAGYARQRLRIQSSDSLNSAQGSQGTGIQASAIEQLRSQILDGQIADEASTRGSLEAMQQALEQAQSILGQSLSRQSSSTQSADAASQVGDLNELVGLFGDFFNSFQNLSANPTSEDARRDVISKAQSLAGRFNVMDQRLGELQGKLLQSAQTDAKTANQLLADIASLNGEIVRAEGGEPGAANDLRDTRQQKIEELAKYLKITTVEGENGAVDISAGGASLISEGTLGERLQARTVDGRLEVATAQSGMRLDLDGGSLSGTVQASNGAVAGLRQNLDNLAKSMITQVNGIHRGGYNLNGATGQDFFTGTDAASLRVAQALEDDPALIQASGDASARSDNQVALALARLASAPQASLNNQTFAQNLAEVVSGVSESLASVNSGLDNQKVVADTLQKQRDSVSGVSMDEELTSMVKFQKAFEASAKLITIIDEMLDTVLSLKR